MNKVEDTKWNKGSRSRSRSPIRTRDFNGRRDRDRSSSGRGQFSRTSDKMVYLSNLPFEIKWMELKDLIREKAGEVNFVEVLEGRDGRSKGAAVVEFKHKDAALKCVENMHRTDMKGRLIVAKEIRDPTAFFRKVKEDTGVDFLGMGDRPGQGQGNRGGGGRFSGGASQASVNDNETYGLSPSFLAQLNISTPLQNRVFITNISYNCGVGKLYDICSLAGKITWFDLQLDKEGKSKGMAVCQYSHPIEAVQAISMLHNQRLFDRTLSVKMDMYPREGEVRREGELPFGLRSVGMGLGANGAPLTDVASVISSISTPSFPSQQNGSSNSMPPPQAANPFISSTNAFGPGNIQQSPQFQSPYPSQNEPIVPSGGIPVSPANVYQQNTQQSPYQPPQQNLPTHSAQQGGYFNAPSQPVATNRPTSTPYGGPPYNPKPVQPVPPVAGSGGYPPSHRGGGPTNVPAGAGGWGSSSGSYTEEVSRVILIKNLPSDYTWQIVSDRVLQFGDVESVEMVSPGVAKVRFTQIKDAERARAALQGTTVEGRVIGIEYL